MTIRLNKLFLPVFLLIVVISISGCFEGDKGNVGTEGIQGEQGLQGIQGIQGEQGSPGQQGIQGIPGERGPEGPQGLQGPQGIPGSDVVDRECDPGTPCYTYAPETRGVGECYDGKFQLNTNNNLCSCIEEVGPNASEYCNGYADDCDGETDEGDVCLCADGEEIFAECTDYGDEPGPGITVNICEGIAIGASAYCCGPELYSCYGTCFKGLCFDYKVDALDPDGDGYYIPEDCDDYNPDIHPGASEVCNGEDDDCDYIIDESCDVGISRAEYEALLDRIETLESSLPAP